MYVVLALFQQFDSRVSRSRSSRGVIPPIESA
jgi:hypothetical protein